MSSQMITVCQICWKMTNHKTNPTLTTADKSKKDKSDKQICQVCNQVWSPVQLVKNNGKWIYIRPRPANVPGEFKMCDKKGKCIKGASCTFAHSREELESWNREREGPPMPDKPRPAPLISGNRYMMCTHHSNGKRCLYGADCKFAHSQEELDLWNATIVARSDGGHSSSRTNSFSLDTSSDNKHVTSPTRQYSDESKRIIPGLHTTTKPSSNRTRLSSLSSNTSNTSDHMSSSKNLPVSLTLSHNNKESNTALVYRCDLCDCTCTSMKQLLEHKAGAKHKQIARCNSLPDEPTIRSRPILNCRGIQEYSICKSVNESGRCKFGTGCPEAHSYEELESWNSQLNNSLQALIPSKEDVIPFLEKIRRELDSTELTINDLLQPKFGITIEEVSGTRLEINHTGGNNLKWIFRTTVKESCQLLGMIMLGEQYPQFTFTSLTISTATVHPTTTPYAIEAKHSLYPGDSFTTQVEFKQQTGCFPQVVVFKFNGFFMGTLLKVTSMSQESFELQNLHRQVTETQSGGSEASNWDTVVQVIALDGADLKERDQCPSDYPLNPDLIRLESLSQNLTMVTYKEHLHTLLYLEENERQKVLATSHLPNMICEVTPGYRDEYMYHCAPQGFAYLTFQLDDLADSSPQLIMRNKICEVKAAKSNTAYQGILEMIGRETLVVRVKEECATMCKQDKASVRFTQKRKDFKYMHYAIDHVNLNLMFPDYSPDRSAKPEELAMLLEKTNLNKAQKGVIEDILDPFTSHIPTLVCGPFGTGKTSTLVEAVSILLQVNTMSRILVCTHSNSAADIYIERLDKKFGSEFLRGKVLRHFYHERKQTTIKRLLLNYTYMVANKFELPPLPQLKELSVVVTTIEQSGDLAYYPGLEPGHFTHIFIDEAAQVMECRALIALQLAVRRKVSTKIVLAGDHMQMEEELFSKQAKSLGLHRSVLERLMSCPLYATAEGRDCCTQLVHNYRTHPDILKLPSELFYGNSLVSMATPGGGDINAILPKEPLAFYGVQGQENKDNLSFSYDNFVEAREVEQRIIKLASLGLAHSDICVLTPYNKQCSLVRYLLRKINMSDVTVLTTQGVQGREYRALIVSTVRTCRSETPDIDHESSFINDPKLFNMAITRAKDWLIVVGDPYTLCTVGPNRSCWEKLIKYCISYNSFHFPNIVEFLNSLSRPLATKFPSISQVTPRKDEPLSDYTETERKQFFRQKLLPIVQQMCPQHGIKVTSVLVEMNTQKMIELFASDNNELQKKVRETLEFLGIEDCSPSPVPKYLSKQLEYLNEHEKLIQSYVPQLTQTHNTHAIRILHEQLYLLKEQRRGLNTQYHLMQRFNAALAPPRPLMMNGSTPRSNGPLPPPNMSAIARLPSFNPPNSFLSNNSVLNTTPSTGPATPVGLGSTPPGHTGLGAPSLTAPSLTAPSLAAPPLAAPLAAPSLATPPILPSNQGGILGHSLMNNNTPPNSTMSPVFSPVPSSNSTGPPPGWAPFNSAPPFSSNSSSAFSSINNASSSPMGGGMFNNDVVGSSVIGAPLYNSNNETNPETSGPVSPTTVTNRNLGPIGDKHF